MRYLITDGDLEHEVDIEEIDAHTYELRVGDAFFRVGISAGVVHEATAQPAGRGTGL